MSMEPSIKYVRHALGVREGVTVCDRVQEHLTSQNLPYKTPGNEPPRTKPPCKDICMYACTTHNLWGFRDVWRTFGGSRDVWQCV